MSELQDIRPVENLIKEFECNFKVSLLLCVKAELELKRFPELPCTA